jgi:4-aminobutyrate aminotransferase-like enzyme/Ser/Thr protein kinase RdoA (MazF antagonist)
MRYLTIPEVESMVKTYYSIEGNAVKMHGEIDFNYKIKTVDTTYLFKISDAKSSDDDIDFQVALYNHVDALQPEINYSRILKSNQGNQVEVIIDSSGQSLKVRLYSWVDGLLWSNVNTKNAKLRQNLGKHGGLLSQAFKTFSHPLASRTFRWDLAQFQWTLDHLSLFQNEKLEILQYFQNAFLEIQEEYKTLRKQVIHNDINDNNIVVSSDFLKQDIEAIIDYGDAVYTQSINDVAIAAAYAAMQLEDPLEATIDIVKGYHCSFPLLEEELSFLYVLIGIRLVISVTQSALNKIQNPENEYLQISDKDGWDLLVKWRQINPNFAHYSYRAACGFEACPQEKKVIEYISTHPFSPQNLFSNNPNAKFESVDLSIASEFLGNYTEFNNDAIFNKKIANLLDENPNVIFVGGYKEARGIYNTPAFKQQTNDGFCYRTLHLGLDFWTQDGAAIHAPYDGEIVAVVNNKIRKDYGPTIIMKHTIDSENSFYTLYGHLSEESLLQNHIGKQVKRGDSIATLGKYEVNGNWPPHLHFQIILDLLGNTTNFDGVASINQWEVFKSLCPDPNLIFNIPELNKIQKGQDEIYGYRKEHLGRSLSLSYQNHLTILRGSDVYLFDQWAQPYLDTVNNVPHVGHENPKVVAAGQKQMAVLNTNTRYLHPKIIDFTKELLKTFPPELCVVHFVNSGSEANELALRMARMVTQQKDIIALEMGYHGNTQGCVDISSYKFNRKGGTGKPEHTAIVPLPDAFRGIYRGENTDEKYASHLQTEIDILKSKNRNVAAFIAESIVSCGGQIDLPEGYLEKAYAIVRKEGGLCIADEVQVGFGRVGAAFWGFQLHNVIPDIVVLGKPIGNGHPLGAVVCTKAVAEGFANGMEYFNTFGGNPVSCSIGLAVLEEIKTKNLQQNALEVGNYLIAKLKEMQKQFPLIADVRGKGLFLGIEFLEPDFVPATAKVKYIAERMKERFVLMSIDGPDNNVLKIKPPITFTKANADFLIQNLTDILNEDYIKQ